MIREHVRRPHDAPLSSRVSPRNAAVIPSWLQLRFPVSFSGESRQRGIPATDPPPSERPSLRRRPWMPRVRPASHRATVARALDPNCSPACLSAPHPPPTHLPRPSGPRATPTPPSRRPSHRRRARSCSVSLSATCVPVVSQRSRNKILNYYYPLFTCLDTSVGGVFSFLVSNSPCVFPFPRRPAPESSSSSLSSSLRRRRRHCRSYRLASLAVKITVAAAVPTRSRSRMNLATDKNRGPTRASHGAHR